MEKHEIAKNNVSVFVKAFVDVFVKRMEGETRNIETHVKSRIIKIKTCNFATGLI